MKKLIALLLLISSPAFGAYGGYAHLDATTSKLVTTELQTGVGFVGLLSTTTGINGKSATTTDLYTVPAGKTAVITAANICVTSVTGFAVVGTAGIGVAAGESDIFPAVAMTGLDVAGECFSFLNNILVFKSAAAASVIKLGIDVAYTSTTTVLSVDLLGYLK